jgi:hypothetical protein
MSAEWPLRSATSYAFSPTAPRKRRLHVGLLHGANPRISKLFQFCQRSLVRCDISVDERDGVLAKELLQAGAEHLTRLRKENDGFDTFAHAFA